MCRLSYSMLCECGLYFKSGLSFFTHIIISACITQCTIHANQGQLSVCNITYNFSLCLVPWRNHSEEFLESGTEVQQESKIYENPNFCRYKYQANLPSQTRVHNFYNSLLKTPYTLHKFIRNFIILWNSVNNYTSLKLFEMRFIF